MAKWMLPADTDRYTAVRVAHSRGIELAEIADRVSQIVHEYGLPVEVADYIMEGGDE